MHCVLYNPSLYNQTLPQVPSPTSLSFSSQFVKSDLLQPINLAGTGLDESGEILLPVECGNNSAILYLSRLCQGSKGPCILFQNYWLTPNEFQYISGRETAKDWKRSIRHNGKSIKLLISKGVIGVHSPICECGTQTQKETRRMELLHNNNPNNHHHSHLYNNNGQQQGVIPNSSNHRNGTSIKRESRLTSIIDHLLISKRTNEVEYQESYHPSSTSSEPESWTESCTTTTSTMTGGGSVAGAGASVDKFLVDTVIRTDDGPESPSAQVSTSSMSEKLVGALPEAASADSGEDEPNPTNSTTPTLQQQQSSSILSSGRDQTTPVTKTKGSKRKHHNNNNNSSTTNNNIIKNERQSPESIRSSPSPTKAGSGGGSGAPSPPLKQMEQMMGRNYSDFMRSLAAKYNNSNPNDLYASARNSFPFDPRFLKPAAAAASLLAFQQQQAAAEKLQFPYDMSSTQTLLSMVRSAAASANNNNVTTSSSNSGSPGITAQQLLSALPNAGNPLKRASSPLDLSSAAALAAVGMTQPKKSKHRENNRDSATKRCGSSCSGCSTDADGISNWTVDDVCRFVLSIDLCAEYVQAFRDHSIDGSSLPLLTEEHLIQNMNMKLGPALKFKSTVAKKLGNCPVCLHCVHCHMSAESK